jgi:hypothetical protein
VAFSRAWIRSVSVMLVEMAVTWMLETTQEKLRERQKDRDEGSHERDENDKHHPSIHPSIREKNNSPVVVVEGDTDQQDNVPSTICFGVQPPIAVVLLRNRLGAGGRMAKSTDFREGNKALLLLVRWPAGEVVAATVVPVEWSMVILLLLLLLLLYRCAIFDDDVC